MLEELTESVKDTIKSAARKLTGFLAKAISSGKWRSSTARVIHVELKRVFGWGRDAVNTGLNELSAQGFVVWTDSQHVAAPRPKSSNLELASVIHAMVEPLSQADPKFQTPLAYTRITAKAVYEHLKANAAGGESACTSRTHRPRLILKSLGLPLAAGTARPSLKKIPETDAIFGHLRQVHTQAAV